MGSKVHRQPLSLPTRPEQIVVSGPKDATNASNRSDSSDHDPLGMDEGNSTITEPTSKASDKAHPIDKTKSVFGQDSSSENHQKSPTEEKEKHPSKAEVKSSTKADANDKLTSHKIVPVSSDVKEGEELIGSKNPLDITKNSLAKDNGKIIPTATAIKVEMVHPA